MKPALLGSLGIFGLVIAALAFNAIANEGGHHRLHWGEDRAAYTSYREWPKAELRARRARFRRALGLAAPAEKLDKDYLVSSLEILSGKKDPVLKDRGGLKGRAAARAFMKSEFEAFGFKTHEEAYSTGVNFVAERPGASGKFLIVSAHYDSMKNPGADDDGSGTVALMAIAKLLGDRPLAHGVRFVAFDQEEQGLVGSGAYVKALMSRGEKASILGDLQLEMLGYNGNGDGKFHVISCDRSDSRFLADAYVDAVAKLKNGLQITSACTDRSDHARFWNEEMPAVVVSQNFFGGDSNPCYHRACDTIEKMHMKYFTDLAETSANVVVELISK